MERVFFETEDGSFVVHIDSSDEYRTEGAVYPINTYLGSSEYSYQSKQDGSGMASHEGAMCLFEFSFCWRGVWEGRIYFKDDEYWSEQLREMADLWDLVQKYLKDRIKKDNPDEDYISQ